MRLAWIVLPMLIHSFLIPQEDYWKLWGVNKFIGWEQFLVLTFSVLCYGVGVYASGMLRPRVISHNERMSELGLMKKVMWFGVALCSDGQYCLVLSAVRQGFGLSMMNETLGSSGTAAEVEEMKQEVFKTIPGVTTATQFAMAIRSMGYSAVLLHKE